MKRSKFLKELKRELEDLASNVESDPYVVNAYYLDIDENEAESFIGMFENLFELPWEKEDD